MKLSASASLQLLLVCLCLVGFSHQQSAVRQNGTQSGKPLSTLIEWLLQVGAGAGGGGSPPPVNEDLILPVDPTTCKQCTCGLANKQTRIIGGQVTKVNQYPWMALLMYNNRFYCGATLINAKYLLTASHCVNGFDMKRITARMAEHARDSITDIQHIERKIVGITKHRGYDDNSFNNDIAVLKLDRDVAMDGDVRPVCLPPLGKSFTGSQGVVAGWGVTAPGGSPSQTLNEVTVPIMSNSDCRKTAYGARKITDNMMCAGYPEGKRDSCQGDSGGPLCVMNGTRHHIAGVVSWGEGCAVANYPGVYARVNRYITWIKRNTRDACYCDG